MKEKIKKVGIAALWLALWQLAALQIDNDILLAGPAEVLKSLVNLSLKPLAEALAGAYETADFSFYKICWFSLKRILLGFFLAFAAGGTFGALSYRFRLIRELGEPVLSVMKSIPVASFVVLLLIWQGSENLSIWISFFVAFPNLCVSTRSGLSAVDPKLKEMADVFDIKGIKRAVMIYRPSLLRFLRTGMEISVGMAFKSGVAAEVIGVPEYSIGERIYVSKIYLDTPGLFAWTVTLILLSFAAEKLILKLTGLLERPVKRYARALPELAASGTGVCGNRQPAVHGAAETSGRETDSGAETAAAVHLSHIFKAFGDKQVLCDINADLSAGGRYLLMGPSGSGKTTLLRILAGLEQPDRGKVRRSSDRVSYLFQEDRLLENEFTITNIMLTKTRSYFQAAAEILPPSCLKQPASQLSGGMKRRCALARALFYRIDDPAAVCLLDEPFAGLDPETKEKAAAFIKKYLNGRTLIVATHDKEDAELLGGTIWRIAE